MGLGRMPDGEYAGAGGLTYEPVEMCRSVRQPPVRRPAAACTSLELADVLGCAEGLLDASAAMAPCFISAYDRLVTSLVDEARLHQAGLRVVAQRLAHALANQMVIRDLVDSGQLDPGAQGDDAVVVTGLPGAGTTRLQHLLAAHAGFNVPAPWELLSPAGDPQPGLPASAGAGRVWHDTDAARDVRDGTPAALGDGQLLSYAFHSPAASVDYRLPGYSEWLATHDATTAYMFHRFAMNAILERVGGGIPVLADPFHSWRLDGLLANYPQAVVVRVHRDPLESLLRVASATVRRRAWWSDEVNPREVLMDWALQFAAVMATPEWAGDLTGDRVLDIDATELTHTPMLVVRRICAHLGVPLPVVVERRVMDAADGWTARPAAGDLGAFGVGLRDLPAFFLDRRGEYLSRFGLSH